MENKWQKFMKKLTKYKESVDAGTNDSNDGHVLSNEFGDMHFETIGDKSFRADKLLFELSLETNLYSQAIHILLEADPSADPCRDIRYSAAMDAGALIADHYEMMCEMREQAEKNGGLDDAQKDVVRKAHAVIKIKVAGFYTIVGDLLVGDGLTNLDRDVINQMIDSGDSEMETHTAEEELEWIRGLMNSPEQGDDNSQSRT